MASLLNGLRAFGESVAGTAERMGLEEQKNQLARQTLELADNLARGRGSFERQEAAGIAEKSQGREFDFRGRESAAQRSLASTEGAAQRASEERRTEMTVNAVPPEIRSAKEFTKLSPDEKKAVREQAMIKAGLPPWLISATEQPMPAAPSPVTGTPEAKGVIGKSGYNDKALEGIPGAGTSIIKGMVEGRISPPSSFAAATPYWQAMIQKAAEYDPTFDETTWSGRVATRKDFASGQSAKAVTAMNTALGHAGTLMDDFEKLGNFGGVGTVLNAPLNYLQERGGDARQTKARQTIDALASEARKVFAATGGGNLTELQEWQKNFPLNGSPDQQKASLTGFVELLDGRLHSLADQYNRGMGKTDDPVNLLEGKGREAYMKLTGREPEGGTGYQLGKKPEAAPQTTKTDDPLTMARDALSRGAPRDAVIKRLRENGIDPGGL